MSDYLGRMVQWQDGKGVQGGGHHTGCFVLNPQGGPITFVQDSEVYCLVLESCDKIHAWPRMDDLKGTYIPDSASRTKLGSE